MEREKLHALLDEWIDDDPVEKGEYVHLIISDQISLEDAAQDNRFSLLTGGLTGLLQHSSVFKRPKTKN